jgi:hypothetical protein
MNEGVGICLPWQRSARLSEISTVVRSSNKGQLPTPSIVTLGSPRWQSIIFRLLMGSINDVESLMKLLILPELAVIAVDYAFLLECQDCHNLFRSLRADATCEMQNSDDGKMCLRLTCETCRWECQCEEPKRGCIEFFCNECFLHESCVTPCDVNTYSDGAHCHACAQECNTCDSTSCHVAFLKWCDTCENNACGDCRQTCDDCDGEFCSEDCLTEHRECGVCGEVYVEVDGSNKRKASSTKPLVTASLAKLQ